MNISDEKLYELCQKYGQQARTWRQKFAGLLPEVARRKLYEKKGFGSIFEFAAKLAGMSEEQVRRVLNLEKKFEAMPILKTILVSGDVSMNKLAKVASIATTENQELLANQVKLLSYSALETLARDERMANHNGLFEPKNSDKSVRTNTNPSQNSENANAAVEGSIGPNGASLEENSVHDIYLTPEVRQKLLELQNKGIDVNELLLEFLNKREFEIEKEKNKISEAMKKEEELAREAELHNIPVKKSRYVPAKIKKIIQQEFGTKCAIPFCIKLSQEIHHTQRFALSQSHNPYFLAPLCENHHQIAHAIDVKVQEKRRGTDG